MNITTNHPSFKEDESYRKIFDEFCERVDLLKDINDNEKPLVIGNILQRDECMPLLSPIYRFFNNQNSKTLTSFIEQEFSRYMNLLDKLLDKSNHNYFTYDLLQDTDLFNQHVAVGLIRLKITYIECKEINYLIDSILLTFHDFHDMKQTYVKTISTVKKKRRDSEG